MTTATIGTDGQAMRQAMVSSQLRTNAVDDRRVVTAMAEVARERFLPNASSALAYRDTAIPLGGGRAVNPPLATARLLTQAELRSSDRVLLIGAAGGYAAALLAELVAEVVAVEEQPALAEFARGALADVPNVTMVEGPLAAGAPGGAPFDVLVIDGAVERLPVELVEQLHPDARIVAGLVDRGVTRLAAGRVSAGGYGLQPFLDAECVVLPGFEGPRGFQF
ncbi:protein-L-isoaspartate O-methyltransferase family protein [Sphingomonas gellani]|nr:protein-L-isoaspartate O-methyltransferase [Sphingomonas gellani]